MLTTIGPIDDQTTIRRMKSSGFKSTTYLLQKLAGRTLMAAEVAVSELGINARQFLMLRAIADDTEVSQTDIAARLGLDPTVLGRLMEELETGGYLERQRAAHDRRRHVLRLTKTGTKLLADAERQFDTAEAEALELLPKARRTELQALLQQAAGYTD
jgi:DNA-binding MarR family transcriptional regulator